MGKKSFKPKRISSRIPNKEDNYWSVYVGQKGPKHFLFFIDQEYLFKTKKRETVEKYIEKHYPGTKNVIIKVYNFIEIEGGWIVIGKNKNKGKKFKAIEI